MASLLEVLHAGRVVLMDGAMGTELLRAGLDEGMPGEAWNLVHPERVHAIHDRYLAAGAECLLTNTFQALPAVLTRRGLAGQFAPIVRSAIAMARSAAGPSRFVLAAFGPGDAAGLAAAPDLDYLLSNADGCLLETCTGLGDLEFLDQLQARTGLPVLVSFAFRRCPSTGRPVTNEGLLSQALARLVRSRGLAALGANCGRDIDVPALVEILEGYRQETSLPLFARPNAGSPVRNGSAWHHPLTPAELPHQLPRLLATGVRMVGGCCGTTPEHIAACRPVIDDWNRSQSFRRSDG